MHTVRVLVIWHENDRHKNLQLFSFAYRFSAYIEFFANLMPSLQYLFARFLFRFHWFVDGKKKGWKIPNNELAK